MRLPDRSAAMAVSLQASILAALYLSASAIAFLAYAVDKKAARARRARISENTLHLLALFGGWPGALLAQKVLRHKSSKKSFRRVFLGTVILNCFGLLCLLPSARRLMMSFLA
jgi:uncharacterized membrane protein YsdA (DUF1294 family)